MLQQKALKEALPQVGRGARLLAKEGEGDARRGTMPRRRRLLSLPVTCVIYPMVSTALVMASRTDCPVPCRMHVLLPSSPPLSDRFRFRSFAALRLPLHLRA